MIKPSSWRQDTLLPIENASLTFGQKTNNNNNKDKNNSSKKLHVGSGEINVVWQTLFFQKLQSLLKALKQFLHQKL